MEEIFIGLFSIITLFLMVGGGHSYIRCKFLKRRWRLIKEDIFIGVLSIFWIIGFGVGFKVIQLIVLSAITAGPLILWLKTFRAEHNEKLDIKEKEIDERLAENKRKYEEICKQNEEIRKQNEEKSAQASAELKQSGKELISSIMSLPKQIANEIAEEKRKQELIANEITEEKRKRALGRDVIDKVNKLLYCFAEEFEKNSLEDKSIHPSKIIKLEWDKKLIVDEKNSMLSVVEIKTTAPTDEEILNMAVKLGGLDVANIVDKVCDNYKENKKDYFKINPSILDQFEFKDILKYEVVDKSTTRSRERTVNNQTRIEKEVCPKFEIVVYLDRLNNSIFRYNDSHRKPVEEIASVLEYIIRRKK